jgi:two-component system, NarL family, nitrate/nitrite response regulator NarL
MRILIADDHPLVIDGLKIAIQQFAPDAQILECGDYSEAEQRATQEDDIDLAILDLQMPGMDGVRGVQKFVNNHPDTPALIVSGNYTVSDVSEVLTHGAAGFLPKSLAKTGLVNAIKLVLGGEKFIPADILVKLNSPNEAGPGGDAESGGNELQKILTGREAQVLGELIDGLQNKEIARILDIQEVTVKLHVKNIYKKIGASNRAHAVKIAYDKGWAQK